MTLNMTKDASGAPAVSLEKLPPELRTPAEKAQLALNMIGMDGARLQVRAWPDHSGSMAKDYEPGRDGTPPKMQGVMTRSLAATFPIDPDGVIQIYPWDSQIHWAKKGGRIFGSNQPIACDEHNYATIVRDAVYKPNEMGSTKLLLVLKEIETIGRANSSEVAMNIIYTDGAPDYGTEEACLVQIAQMADTVPGQWLKFVALKDDAVAFLTDVDNMEERRPDLKRVRDNAHCVYMQGFASMRDLDFYRDIYRELDTWWASLSR